MTLLRRKTTKPGFDPRLRCFLWASVVFSVRTAVQFAPEYAVYPVREGCTRLFLLTPDGLYRQVLFERAAQVVAVEVGVDFGGEDALVSQHLLHLTYACAPFEQVRGERVAESMG